MTNEILTGAVATVLASIPAAASLAEMESFAARWGVPMLLVVLVVLYGIGSARRREARDNKREDRLLVGLDSNADAIRGLRKSVDRSAAATLAVTDADPNRINDVLRRLTAGDSECAECPLASMSQSDVPAFLERLGKCRENHSECYIYDASG